MSSEGAAPVVVSQLADRIAGHFSQSRVARPQGRVIVGIAGTPGAGKSTLAAELLGELTARGIAVANVPMDGFHLADGALRELGRLDRKGALDTFDGWGYVALLRRLRTETAHTVYAPGFDRELEQPLAGAIAIPPDVPIVITEGNYLLIDQDPWSQIAGLLDGVWFVSLDAEERRRRLRARHERFGKTAEAARAWVDEVDEPNAVLVEATVSRATGLLLPGD